MPEREGMNPERERPERRDEFELPEIKAGEMLPGAMMGAKKGSPGGGEVGGKISLEEKKRNASKQLEMLLGRPAGEGRNRRMEIFLDKYGHLLTIEELTKADLSFKEEAKKEDEEKEIQRIEIQRIEIQRQQRETANLEGILGLAPSKHRSEMIRDWLRKNISWVDAATRDRADKAMQESTLAKEKIPADAEVKLRFVLDRKNYAGNVRSQQQAIQRWINENGARPGFEDLVVEARKALAEVTAETGKQNEIVDTEKMRLEIRMEMIKDIGDSTKSSPEQKWDHFLNTQTSKYGTGYVRSHFTPEYEHQLYVEYIARAELASVLGFFDGLPKMTEDDAKNCPRLSRSTYDWLAQKKTTKYIGIPGITEIEYDRDIELRDEMDKASGKLYELMIMASIDTWNVRKEDRLKKYEELARRWKVSVDAVKLTWQVAEAECWQGRMAVSFVSHPAGALIVAAEKRDFDTRKTKPVAGGTRLWLENLRENNNKYPGLDKDIYGKEGRRLARAGFEAWSVKVSKDLLVVPNDPQEETEKKRTVQADLRIKGFRGGQRWLFSEKGDVVTIPEDLLNFKVRTARSIKELVEAGVIIPGSDGKPTIKQGAKLIEVPTEILAGITEGSKADDKLVELKVEGLGEVEPRIVDENGEEIKPARVKPLDPERIVLVESDLSLDVNEVEVAKRIEFIRKEKEDKAEKDGNEPERLYWKAVRENKLSRSVGGERALLAGQYFSKMESLLSQPAFLDIDLPQTVMLEDMIKGAGVLTAIEAFGKVDATKGVSQKELGELRNAFQGLLFRYAGNDLNRRFKGEGDKKEEIDKNNRTIILPGEIDERHPEVTPPPKKKEWVIEGATQERMENARIRLGEIMEQWTRSYIFLMSWENPKHVSEGTVMGMRDWIMLAREVATSYDEGHQWGNNVGFGYGNYDSNELAVLSDGVKTRPGPTSEMVQAAIDYQKWYDKAFYRNRGIVKNRKFGFTVTKKRNDQDKDEFGEYTEGLIFWRSAWWKKPVQDL